ncbi:unnamed protein product [Chrysoparadoxa australica]
MGCTSSKESVGLTISPKHIRPSKYLQDLPSPLRRENPSFERTVLRALCELKWHLDGRESQDAIHDTFSFTKIILKFGTIQRVLKHVQDVFHSFDMDHSGKISKDEFKTAMSHLKAHTDSISIEEMFEVCNMEENDALGMREFLVVLAVARLMQSIPEISSPTATDQPVSPTAATTLTGSTVVQPKSDERPPKTRGASGEMSTIHELREGESVIAESVVTEEPPQEGTSLQSLAEGPSTTTTIVQPTAREHKHGSFTKVKWSRIPSMVRVASKGTFQPEVASAEEAELHKYANEVRYVMDLIIQAYYQFDPVPRGYILRSELNKQLQEAEVGESEGKFSNISMWDNLAWDSDGRLSFSEFVFTFSSWLDVEDSDDEDEGGEGVNAGFKGSSVGLPM